MAKHVGPPDSEDTTRAAVATLAVVAVIAAVIAALAVFRPDDGAADPADAVTDVMLSTPDPSQPVRAGATLRKDGTSAGKVTGKPQRVNGAGKALRRKTQRALEVEPTTFRVSTFNVLGASHTKPGGNKRGWAPASVRMAWATSILRSWDVDVVGFQEFESSQVSTFLARTAGAWDVYPGNAGDPRNSIAWRKDTWELVSAATTPIPYFHGSTVQMPYVRLRNIASGQDVVFINVHNPASTGRWGNNERWRDVATAREIALVNSLHAQDLPVVLTGDFNERDEVFCRVTGSGAMVAAAGGSTAGGRCLPPAGMGVDWIFGSAVIDFTDFVRQDSGLVNRATDHPFVVSAATIPPLTDSQPPG